jgi:hypothetical protein
MEGKDSKAVRQEHNASFSIQLVPRGRKWYIIIPDKLYFYGT